MAKNLTRRTTLAGAAALPLAPAAAMASPTNATDAIWPEYLAAQKAENRLGLTDEKIDARANRRHAAEVAVFAAPVATMVDVERKLAAVRRRIQS